MDILTIFFIAVGLAMDAFAVSIITPVIVIGLVTFVLSCIGVVIGGRFGHLFEKKIEIAGGIILIVIGTKILLEHLGYLQ